MPPSSSASYDLIEALFSEDTRSADEEVSDGKHERRVSFQVALISSEEGEQFPGVPRSEHNFRHPRKHKPALALRTRQRKRRRAREAYVACCTEGVPEHAPPSRIKEKLYTGYAAHCQAHPMTRPWIGGRKWFSCTFSTIVIAVMLIIWRLELVSDDELVLFDHAERKEAFIESLAKTDFNVIRNRREPNRLLLSMLVHSSSWEGIWLVCVTLILGQALERHYWSSVRVAFVVFNSILANLTYFILFPCYQTSDISLVAFSLMAANIICALENWKILRWPKFRVICITILMTFWVIYFVLMEWRSVPLALGFAFGLASSLATMQRLDGYRQMDKLFIDEVGLMLRFDAYDKECVHWDEFDDEYDDEALGQARRYTWKQRLWHVWCKLKGYLYLKRQGLRLNGLAIIAVRIIGWLVIIAGVAYSAEWMTDDLPPPQTIGECTCCWAGVKHAPWFNEGKDRDIWYYCLPGGTDLTGQPYVQSTDEDFASFCEKSTRDEPLELYNSITYRFPPEPKWKRIGNF